MGPVRIAFSLAHPAEIRIEVLDLLGRRVAAPAEGAQPAGTRSVQWDGRTRQGESAPTGTYFIRYVYPGGQDMRRVVLVR